MSTQVNIDIVPAVTVGSIDSDPILIYSFSKQSPRKNWPRDHYKRWVKCHLPDKSLKIAPSYYIESLLYKLPNHLFSGNLASDFVSPGQEITDKHGGVFYSLPRIAGEGELFSSSEWAPEKFKQFRTRLAESIEHSKRALTENDPSRAKAAWRMAFAGYDG